MSQTSDHKSMSNGPGISAADVAPNPPDGTSNGNLARFAGVVALGSIASKILGFLRETSLASHFGATYATDAYLMAMVIPSLMLMGIGPAVTTTLIPVFADLEKRRGRQAAFKSVSSIVNACFVVAAAVSVAGMAFSGPLVRLVAPGFSGETYELAVELTTIMFPIAVFSTVSSVLTGLLQAVGSFAAPAMTGLAQNIIIITSIVVFGPRYGIAAVAIGTVLGSLSMLLVQVPALLRVGYRHQLALDWHDEGLRQVGALIGPIIAGSAAGQAGAVVLRILASRLPEGSITYLNYGQRLVGLPVGVFGSALITVLYPTLARMYSEDSRAEMVTTFERSVGIVFFILAPMAVGLMILSTPVVRLAFERGAFTAQATEATAEALRFLCIGIPATSLSELATKTFYATHDTITPVFVGLGAVGVNIAMSLALVGKMGHTGLAIASAIQPVASFLTLYVLFKRRVKPGIQASKNCIECSIECSSREEIAPCYSLAASLTKSAVSAALMWAVVSPFHRWISGAILGGGIGPQAARLAASVVVGAAVYFLSAVVLKSEELDFAMGAIRKRVQARS